jgi:hypothetical protein
LLTLPLNAHRDEKSTATRTPTVGPDVSATNSDYYFGSAVVNHAPVAVDDSSYKTKKNTPLTIVAPGILANDTDADSDLLTAVLLTAPRTATWRR